MAAKWQSGDAPSSGDRLVRKGRLLIVDDEPQIGNTLRLLLDPDHEVVPVTSGREALERIKTDTAFDIIFCDLMMPEISEWTFTRLFRRWLLSSSIDWSS